MALRRKKRHLEERYVANLYILSLVFCNVDQPGNIAVRPAFEEQGDQSDDGDGIGPRFKQADHSLPPLINLEVLNQPYKQTSTLLHVRILIACASQTHDQLKRLHPGLFFWPQTR